MERMSAREFVKAAAQPVEHKYHAKAVWVDGIRFPSKREAKRWCELKVLLELGMIKNLRRQVVFKLHVNGKLVTTYRADFTYETKDDVFVVEDAKGVRLPEYKLKKKMMLAEYGIDIREV